MGGNPSRLRISHPPQSPDQAKRRPRTARCTPTKSRSTPAAWLGRLDSPRQARAGCEERRGVTSRAARGGGTGGPPPAPGVSGSRPATAHASVPAGSRGAGGTGRIGDAWCPGEAAGSDRRRSRLRTGRCAGDAGRSRAGLAGRKRDTPHDRILAAGVGRAPGAGHSPGEAAGGRDLGRGARHAGGTGHQAARHQAAAAGRLGRTPQRPGSHRRSGVTSPHGHTEAAGHRAGSAPRQPQAIVFGTPGPVLEPGARWALDRVQDGCVRSGRVAGGVAVVR